MPLFKKSHNKDKVRGADNTTADRNDPRFSNSGADPNFMGHDQPGGNGGLRSGNNPTQQPYPNEVGDTSSGHPSKSSKFGGKVETAVGNMIGSDSLRAKGIQKEREARDLNMQSNELAQAESLEREAKMHRDRAMAGSNLVNSNGDGRFNH
ncbi:hypothetical protein BJ322DRAFT_1045913 [Thelephora terrestris]|uniref:Uncharacterized protein n=1 Tax=Thelephora terrestris TaxID=56493 RepID=A0A9P6HJ36_9AGAM|nr:hypothetical protein BJ322DRAFT_1045913 [Thelephora terrestris]